MKRFKTYFGVFIILFVVFTSNAFATQQAVEATVKEYVEGLLEKNESVLNAILSPDAKLTGINNIINKRDEFDKNNFIKAVKAGKIEGWAEDVNIKMTNVVDNIAVVQLEKSSSRLHQDEFVTLALIDGKWKITGLVYSFDKK